ncbi:hypothetical protein [Streptomyces sp. NPDC051567]|uniref:hypothetical protein n=1 Tax=Streptomyces sp. NPDC051567 TaxID=3365660 RepID=UPI0037B0F5A4
MSEARRSGSGAVGGEAGTGSGERRLWKVELAVMATEAECDALTDRFVEVLCPDPDHEGDCEIPWAMHSTDGASLSAKKRRAMLRAIEDTNPS